MTNVDLVYRLQATPDVERFVTEAIENPLILDGLFEVIRGTKSNIRYKSSKIIRKVSEQRPDRVYPYFDDVAQWLRNDNSFIKWDGILTLSNLAEVDSSHKFETMITEYLSLIDDPQMITAANAVGNSWKIVIATPQLENEITKKLLEVPEIVYLSHGSPSPECNRIVCGHVLACFDHYFGISKNQTAMIEFAKRHRNSSRKSLAKKANEFLIKHSSTHFPNPISEDKR